MVELVSVALALLLNRPPPAALPPGPPLPLVGLKSSQAAGSAGAALGQVAVDLVVAQVRLPAER